MYLDQMEREGYSLNHSARVKSTISTFVNFLIEEKGLVNTGRDDSPPALPERRGVERMR